MFLHYSLRAREKPKFTKSAKKRKRMVTSDNKVVKVGAEEPPHKKTKTSEAAQDPKNGSTHSGPVVTQSATDEKFVLDVKAVVSDACSKTRRRHPEVCQAVETFAAEFLSRVTETESRRSSEDSANLQLQLLETETNWSEDATVASLVKRLAKEVPEITTTTTKTGPEISTPLELAENLVFDSDSILRNVRQIQVFDTAASKYLSKVTSQMHTEETGPLQLHNH